MSLWHDVRFAVCLLVKDKWFTAADARARQLGVSRLDALDWRERARSLDAMAIVQPSPLNVIDEGRPAEQNRASERLG